jgi:hypothetical protein
MATTFGWKIVDVVFDGVSELPQPYYEPFCHWRPVGWSFAALRNVDVGGLPR